MGGTHPELIAKQVILPLENLWAGLYKAIPEWRVELLGLSVSLPVCLEDLKEAMKNTVA